MATQKGRNWSSGDIVTAANLGSIERGVSAVAEEYTPTTWANGDTVTAAALNKIEQGIVNAGDSSDFSTAEVTIVNNADSGYGFVAPIVLEEDFSGLLGTYKKGMHSTVEGIIPESGTTTVKIALFDGHAYLDSRYIMFTIESTSGNIFVDGYTYDITGDCTITISSGGR